MPKAIWNGQTLAESDNCELVEGNQYFHRDAVNMDLLRPSEKRHPVWLEGHRQLLRRGRWRSGQPGRRLVLPGSDGRCRAGWQPDRLLEGRPGRSLVNTEGACRRPLCVGLLGYPRPDFKMLNTAPVESCTVANRPGAMSMGPARIRPPSSPALAAVASASSTAK